MENDDIQVLVDRLSRAHASGGRVIARAAIMAEGIDAAAVVAWILDHDGRPESGASAAPGAGLHRRDTGVAAASDRPPVRYVLPASAFGAQPAAD